MGKGLKSGGRDGNLIGLEREDYGFFLEVSDSLEHWRPLNFSLGLCSSGHAAVGHQAGKWGAVSWQSSLGCRNVAALLTQWKAGLLQGSCFVVVGGQRSLLCSSFCGAPGTYLVESSRPTSGHPREQRGLGRGERALS